MLTYAELKNQTLVARKAIIGVAVANRKQIEVIPEGWSNNLLWHMGHLVTVQQMLSHGLRKEPMDVKRNYIKFFTRGTSPADWEGHKTVPDLKRLMGEMIDLTEKVFDDIEPFQDTPLEEPYTNMIGLTMRTPAEALNFSAGHDGIHLGLMLALARAL